MWFDKERVVRDFKVGHKESIDGLLLLKSLVCLTENLALCTKTMRVVLSAQDLIH